jgi:DNA polymerase-3 subunit gamma/tau
MVLQRMAVAQAVPGSVDETDPEAAEMARLAALMPADETQLLYSLCLHGRGELGLAPDEYAALTMVLLRLLAFKPGAQLAAAASAEKKTLKTAETPSAPHTARTESPVSVRADPFGKAQDRPVEALRLAQGERPTGVTAVATPQSATPAAAPAPFAPPGQVLPVMERPRAEPGRPQASPAPATPPQPASPVFAVPVRTAPETRADVAANAQASAATLVPTEEGAFWHLTVQQLVASEAVTALVRELALQSQLVARDTGHWLLRVERESLNQPSSRERLQNALQAAGHAVSLSVEVGRVSDSPARRNAAAAAERQLAAEKIILDDPFVQTMMRDFGAKIVPGSIKPLENTEG